MPSNKETAIKNHTLRIGRALYLRYKALLPDFSFFSFFIIIIYGAYRLGIWQLVKEMLPNLRELKLTEYLMLSAKDDAAVQLLSIAILMLIFVSISQKRIRYALASLLVTVSAFALLIGWIVFGIYEASVQKVMMSDEFFSGWDKIAVSMLSEVPSSFFVYAALATALPIAVSIFLAKRRGFPSKLISFFKVYVPALFLFLLFLTCSPLGEKAIPKVAAGITSLGEKQSFAVLREISMNPNYNILFERINDTGSFGKTPDGCELKEEELGFPVDSISSAKRTERLNILKRGRKYNIVLYLFESTCSKMISFEEKGKPAAPQWQRLAKHAVSLENHYANYPLSANALLSILTSAYEYPGRELVVQSYPDIPLKTLPELLKPCGYRTMLIHTGSLRYANQIGFLKGRSFDNILDSKALKKIPPYNKELGWGLDDRAMTAPVIDFIKEQSDRPFFIVLMPVNPHHPYAIPKDLIGVGTVPEDLPKREYNKRKYLNSLHYSDRVLGEFVDAMEAEGLMDDTLLFVVADHGEAFYEHRGNYNHPFFLYEENVHVPFIIYNKELIKEPVKIDSITSHVDILPTILDLLDIPGRPEHEGISVFSAHRERMALLHTNMRYDFAGLRDGRWKYILRTSDSFEELYDLSNDVAERVNVAEENQTAVRQYRAFLEKARIYKKAYYGKFLKGLTKAKGKSIFDMQETTYEEYLETKRKREEEKSKQKNEKRELNGEQ